MQAVRRQNLLCSSILMGVIVAAAAAGAARAQERPVPFDIPPEPLSQALKDFALASHQQVLFTEALTAGKTSPAIKGLIAPSAAIEQLLTGSGLAVERTPAGALVVSPLPATGTPGPPAPSGDASGPNREATVNEIVVTASRVERRGFTAPTPTTVMSAKAIENQGLTSVIGLLAEIPAARGSVLPTVNAGQLSFFGSYINLRNLGANRTLVLSDGNRVVPSTNTGTVDLNLIPTIAVDRVDVVTGGASAAYGSDAVAGVVNMVLKSRFNGLRVDVQGGETQYSDSRDYRAALLTGAPFQGQRGHVLFAVDYDTNSGIGDIYSRPWSRRDLGTITGANGKIFIANNVQSNTMTYGGIIVGGPLALTAFAPGGKPFALQLGNTFGNPKSNLMSGGGNYPVTIFEASPLQQPQNHLSILGRLDYDLSATIHAAVTFNYGDAVSDHSSVYNRGSFSIPLDNAYLPAATQAAMIADGLHTITLGSAGSNTPFYRVNAQNQTYRIVAALTGDLPGDWRWDAHGEYGQNLFSNSILNDVIKAHQALAVDAVVSPASGQIVCRSTLTAPTNGCVPLDLFGQGAGSAAAARYVTGVSSLSQTTYQENFAVNARGNFLATWAGPISAAAGYEFRRDSISATSDALSQANGFDVYNPKPMSGAIDVNEGYLEAVVPLLRDLKIAKSLDFDGAIRETNYSTSGDVTTWKVGAVYQVTDDLRLRVSESRDIRAPNLSDEFTGGQTATNVISYRGLTQSVAVLTQGNRALTPEIGLTSSAGAIYSPHWLPGFTASVDYYDINVSNAIASLSAQLIVNRCVQGSPVYCSLVSFDGAGNIQLVNISSLNVNKILTSGFDINTSYSFPLSGLRRGFPGKIDISLLGNYLEHMTTTDSSGTIDRAGQVGGGILLPGLDGPRWVWDGNIRYVAGALGLNAHVRYISNGVLDVTATPQTLNVNSVQSRVYLNLSMDYSLKRLAYGGDVQVYAGINNVANTPPPPTLSDSAAGNASNYYDIAGRSYYVGARFKF